MNKISQLSLLALGIFGHSIRPEDESILLRFSFGGSGSVTTSISDEYSNGDESVLPLTTTWYFVNGSRFDIFKDLEEAVFDSPSISTM